MKIIKVIILCILIIITLNGCSSSDDRTTGKADTTVSQNDYKLPAFEAKDLHGTTITNDIFSHQQLTVVNIWGTFSGTCIKEMPDLERLSQELEGENVRIIGIVADMEIDNAQEITAAQGITYTNIIPDESLNNNLLSKYKYIPTTVFVDSEGRLLSTVISGSRNYDSHKAIINSILYKQSQDVSRGGSPNILTINTKLKIKAFLPLPTNITPTF